MFNYVIISFGAPKLIKVEQLYEKQDYFEIINFNIMLCFSGTGFCNFQLY